MVKTKTPSNGFALCIIIVIVIGFFLHFEMGIGSDIGKNLELFNVGAKKWNRNHKWYHHFYNKNKHYTTTNTNKHDPDLYEKHNKLKADYKTLKDHHDDHSAHSHGDQCSDGEDCEKNPKLHTGGDWHHSQTTYTI